MNHTEPEPERMIMPFGKYKGEMLGDIPKNYLEWCVDSLSDLNESLRKAMEKTLTMFRE